MAYEDSELVKDFKSGVTNFRFLANKYGYTLKQVKNYLKHQIKKQDK